MQMGHLLGSMKQLVTCKLEKATCKFEKAIV
jgi:hypothetical protein